MRKSQELRESIQAGGYDGAFACLYPQSPAEECRSRYCDALDAFVQLFGQDRPAVLVCAPGRSEIGGNHTDHQHGIVLAAAVELDVLCVASPNDENIIRIHSQGFEPEEVDLCDLSVQPDEPGRAAALIRGICAWFSSNGYAIGGFDAYTTSQVLRGSGLSSSAAFEVAVGNILRALYKGALSAVQIAIAGRYAENVYFGKPCGLMDQLASSVGGFVQIDFADIENPLVEPVPFRMEDSGYHLCIVDTKGDHADLTGEYAAVTEEMRAVSAFFGKEYLREVDEEEFRAQIARVRARTGDRAVLRAIHFFGENRRVPRMARALRAGGFQDFLGEIIRSGRSSCTCLQNVYSTANTREQGVSLALALSESMLSGKGAWRVHGGGFAGTILAFVPRALLASYCNSMNGVFGANACHVLSVRPVGGIQLTDSLGEEAPHNG